MTAQLMGKKSREKKLRVGIATDDGAQLSGASHRAAVSHRAAARALPSPLVLSWNTPPSDRVSGATRWRWPVILFGLALLVRGALLLQLGTTPYIEVENIDSKGYVEWAERILGGEWLPARHFYQSPLYAYYLALLYGIAGRIHWVPRIIQILLGSCSTVLVYAIARRCFSQRVGIMAALGLALYGPLIAEEIVLAKTALVICATLTAVYLYLGAQTQRQPRRMAVAGLVFGISVVGIGQWLPVLLGLAAYLLIAGEASWLQRRRLALALLGGAASVLVPLVAWNSYWGGGFMLTSGDAGLNLFVGNNPLSSGLPGRPATLRDIPQYEEDDAKRLAEKDAGHSLTPAQVSQHWSRRAARWAISHPGDFVRVSMQKTIAFLNSYEIPDSYHYSFMRAYFLPLLWACLTFALVGPLAVVGLLVAFGHRPARPLYIACLVYAAAIISFYIRSRYRLPAVPFLLIFAAAALDWMISAAQQRQWAMLASVVLALLATSAVVNHTYCEPGRSGAPFLCMNGDVWFDLEWEKLAEWRTSRGDPEGASVYLQRATQVESQRGAGQLFFWLAYVEHQLGEKTAGTPTAQTHFAAAINAYQRAAAAGYRPAAAYNNLALSYRANNQLDQAVESIETAARLDSNNDPDILLRAVRFRVAKGDCAAAENWRQQFERRRAGDPSAADLVQSCGR